MSFKQIVKDLRLAVGLLETKDIKGCRRILHQVIDDIDPPEEPPIKVLPDHIHSKQIIELYSRGLISRQHMLEELKRDSQGFCNNGLGELGELEEFIMNYKS